MTNPGFPPPLSAARQEREAARLIDLRNDIDKALDEVDAALETAITESRKRHPSQYKTQTSEATASV